MVTDPTFTNVTLAWTVLDVPTANDRRVTVEGLTKATTCHWRVRGRNEGGSLDGGQRFAEPTGPRAAPLLCERPPRLDPGGRGPGRIRQ